MSRNPRLLHVGSAGRNVGRRLDGRHLRILWLRSPTVGEVGPNPGLEGAAEQFVDRYSEGLALDAEQGRVDGRNGLMGCTAQLPLGRPVEIELDLLGLERIAAHDQRSQVGDRRPQNVL